MRVASSCCVFTLVVAGDSMLGAGSATLADRFRFAEVVMSVEVVAAPLTFVSLERDMIFVFKSIATVERWWSRLLRISCQMSLSRSHSW